MVAQTESTPSPTYAKIKEWLSLASVIVVVVGGIAAGLLGGMKLVIAPLQTDVRAIHGRLDRMASHIRELDHSTQNEFKAVRQDIFALSERVNKDISALNQRLNEDISALNERMIRLETLLEQVIHQPDTPQ